MKNLLIISVAILILGAIVISQTQDETTIKIDIGATESFGENAAAVKFVDVLEDSRCPTGAECMWAGRARIRIETINGDQAMTCHKLEVGKSDSFVEVAGYRISLKELVPYPKSGETTNKSDYKATFSIMKSK